MGWACGAYGLREGVYRVLVGKPEGRRPMGRPRHRWVDNIRMDLQEVGCGYMDWIGLDQDREIWWTLVSAVMNLRIPWNAGNFLTSCKPVSFSRRTLHHGVSRYLTNSVHKILFYNKFILFLYMFRALCAHHQAVKIVLYSIWYRHTCRWPSGARVESPLATCAPDGHLQSVTIPDAVYYNFDVLMMST